MDIVNALKRIRKRAIEKGLTYDLDSEWFENKLKVGKCEMTGLPFNTELPHNENPFFPSIDRTDNNKGYTKDNCKLVVLGYNQLKLDNDIRTVILFCKKFVEIYERNNK